MRLIVFLIIIVTIAVVALFEAALKIRLLLDTEQDRCSMSARWLYPFFEAQITAQNPLLLTVTLFRQKIFTKRLKQGKKKHPGRWKAVHPEQVRVTAAYGFKNPAVTGAFSGFVTAAGAMFGLNTAQYPDFSPEKEFLRIEAQATVNLGETLINLGKKKYGG